MIDVSVVLPCLNEEQTIGICIDKAKKVFEEQEINGEIVVSDNGSTDDSVKIAEEKGARVVHQKKRGYGNAYLKGFDSAKGRYIVMADADDTYDLLEMPGFLEILKNEDVDFVMGTRLKGKIFPGAMPWLHRYIGNPVLTLILNILFHASISDAHCGMRAFTKEAYKKLDLKTAGMEFASEMVIRATKEHLRIKEIPITYHPRKGSPASLKSFSDGWRHLRFMLLFAPNWLFMVPGIIFFASGLFLIFAILNGPLIIGSMQFDIHPMIFGAFLSILGLQVIIFGLQSKMYASSIGFKKQGKSMEFVKEHFTLEKGSIIGILIFLIGILILLYISNKWLTIGFVPEVKLFMAGMTLTVIGLQLIFSAWFLSMIGIEKK